MSIRESLRLRLERRLWNESGQRSRFWGAVVAAIRSRRLLWRAYYEPRRAFHATGLRHVISRSGQPLPPRGQSLTDEQFTHSRRPLIRWVKGDGRDDEVTRSAIAQATRLFGDTVDYCVAINGIDMERALRVIAWADQPVHIWRQTPADNPLLTRILDLAGCDPIRFGYWWKWFPARMRPNAPEMILDGDQVIVRKPVWFDAWAAGAPAVRVSQDDASDPRRIYGQYAHRVNSEQKLYSGILCLPPDHDFFSRMLRILVDEPLVTPHDGMHDVSEQGCFAASFRDVDVLAVPLHEFPFARVWDAGLDYGKCAPNGEPWGYHFGGAFRTPNHQFARLVRSKEIYWKGSIDRIDGEA